METTENYKLDNEPQAKIYPPSDKRVKILQNPYTQTVKEFMVAMVAGGYTFDDEEDLCNMALKAADKLIDKSGERLN